MADIIWDTSSFDSGIKRAIKLSEEGAKKAQRNVAEDVLRRSQKEVPHDVGTLQASGHVEHREEESIVGYGGKAQAYAAYLHEHPEFNFQKGRKGKYLEDPIKKNLPRYQELYGKVFVEVLR